MSMNTELSKTVSILRETRKAILGRGGDISTTAGLRHISDAIFNIPADASLASYEDSSIAYEKSIPVGVEGCALVSKVGGITYKTRTNNLCMVDGHYNLDDIPKIHDNALTLDLGELDVGTYQLSFYGDYSGAYGLLDPWNAYCDDSTVVDEVNRDNHYIIVVKEKTNITVDLFSEYYYDYSHIDEYYPDNIADYCLKGEITGIMLVKVSDEYDRSIQPDASLEYEPLYQGMQNVKPTSIESLGANLFDESAILELPENLEEGIRNAYKDAGIQVDIGWGIGIDAEYNNHIEWRNGRVFYVQMLDEVDLGDFRWRYFTSTKYFVTYPSLSTSDSTHVAAWARMDLPNCSSDLLGVGLSANYTIKPANTVVFDTDMDKTIGLTNPSSMYGCVISVRNNAYTKSDVFRNDIKGEKFIYLLKTPIETDITHLFSKTSPLLKVVGGGSILFNNEHNQPVPSTIKYIRRTE